MKKEVKVRSAAKVRTAMYSISRKGNLIKSYVAAKPEMVCTKLEVFENAQTAARLLGEIRSLLIACAPVEKARYKSVMSLLKSVLEGRVIDIAYGGQELKLSDLILTRGTWPTANLYQIKLVDDRVIDVEWDVSPGVGETEDDEAVVMLCDIFEDQLWLCIQRGARRSDGGMYIDCGESPTGREVNCWVSFKSAERPGEYSENEYKGWVEFSHDADEDES